MDIYQNILSGRVTKLILNFQQNIKSPKGEEVHRDLEKCGLWEEYVRYREGNSSKNKEGEESDWRKSKENNKDLSRGK